MRGDGRSVGGDCVSVDAGSRCEGVNCGSVDVDGRCVRVDGGCVCKSLQRKCGDVGRNVRPDVGSMKGDNDVIIIDRVSVRLDDCCKR